MTRAVAYYRVSTERQATDDRNSLALQRAAFQRACRDRGYEPVGEFEDVMSGRKAARPAYQRMLAEARSGAFDVIVVTYLDRFGRNDREITMRVLELQDAGIEVEPTEETIPDFITLVLTAWKASQDIERITARTSDGLLAAASRGVAVGRAPYGYRHRWDYTEDGRKTNHRFEVHEPEARWVRWVFEQYVQENASLRQLAFQLSERAAPKRTGATWVAHEVGLLLKRRRYVGEWTFHATANARRDAVDVNIPGGLPAIISSGLYDAAQLRRAAKAALPAGRTQSSTYLLSGLLKCGHCGGPMHGQPTAARSVAGERLINPSYFCGWYRVKRARSEECVQANMHAAHFLDDAVIGFLEDVGRNVVAVREEIGERANDSQRALIEVKHAIEALDDKFARNMRLFDSGALADERQFAAANQMLAGERARLDRERTRLLEAIANTRQRQREVSELPEDLSRLHPSRPIRERKAIVQKYIARVDVFVGSHEAMIYPRYFD